MTSYSRAERTALCDLFDLLGPEAPTLCEGWTTRDLAAHLFVRERRPMAAPGIMLEPLAQLVDRSMTAAQERYDFAELVSKLRGGPPIWSPFRALDEQLNTIEYFVHHEDVRRAQPDWEPRTLDAAEQDALWGRLTAMLRLKASKGSKGTVGLILQRDDTGDVLRLRAGEPAITMVGPPSELLLYAYGRKAVARVAKHGEPDAVADVDDAQLGS